MIARLLHAVVVNRPADLGTKLLNVSSQCPEGIFAKRSHDTWEGREKNWAEAGHVRSEGWLRASP